MSNAVTQQPSTAVALPAYLQQSLEQYAGSNDDFRSGLSTGLSIPRLSIKGKVFRTVVDGEERPITKLDEQTQQEVPVASLPVVILASNRGKMKQYYGNKYDPDAAEASPPRCFSYDGETPSIYADEPQCASCAACPHNVWGSTITENGNKSRACTDGKMLAVIPLTAVTAKAPADSPEGFAYALKLSPTALSRNREERKNNPKANNSWVEFIDLLNQFPTQNGPMEIPVRAVATWLFFDMAAEYPLLRFKPAKFLTAEEYAYVQERAGGEDILNIITDARMAGNGGTPRLNPPAAAPQLTAPVQQIATPQATPAPVQQIVAPAPAVRAPAPPAAAPPQVPAFGDMQTMAPAQPPRPVGRPRKNPVTPAVGAVPTTAPAPTPAAAPAMQPMAQAAPQAIDDALGDIAAMFGSP